MDQLEQDFTSVLLAPQQSPCLSLYQPTHRTQPDRQQDRIRFNNLLDQLDGMLSDKSHPEKRALIAPFRALANDGAFWSTTLDGLAVLSTHDMFKVYRTQRPVPEIAVVADSFYIKPLVRILQSGDQFHILALSRGGARLYQGNRDEIDEIHLPEHTLINSAGDPGELGAERSTRVYGGGGSPRTTRHGTDVRSEAHAIENERLFRDIDRLVLEHHSRPTGLPLLLAALPENRELFRSLSANPNLISGSIDINPDALTLNQLRERAWEVMRPRYVERLGAMVRRFRAAQGTGLATDNLEEVINAAPEGRVELALIEAESSLPGDQAIHDRLDDVAEEVLRAGGEVIIVPKDQMPSETGVAAILRY